MCKNSIVPNGYCQSCSECKKHRVEPATLSRRTGRTTRSVTRALCGMLQGQDVALLVSRQEKKQYVIQKAEDWLRANGWYKVQPGLPVPGRPHSDAFSFGKGKLTVLTAEANMMGVRYDLIVTDHSYDELMAERKLAEERTADINTIKNLMLKHGWNRVAGGAALGSILKVGI